MSHTVYLHNQFLNSAEATIAIDDRGFLLGDGLFETLRADAGHLAYFKEHYARLWAAARYLKISFDYSEQALAKICENLLEKNNLTQTAALRITLSRGCSERGIDLPAQPAPRLLITATPYSPPTTVIKVCVTNIIRNEYSVLSSLKSLNYLDNILARDYARNRGFDEGIMLNTQQHITETSVANLFFKINDILITPPLSDGVLPGIIRQHILNHCLKNKIAIQEKSLTLKDIYTASHAFQTNSLIGLQVIETIHLNHQEKINLSTSLPISC